jgi:hypothetical protein
VYNTNNPLEIFHRVLKYCWLGGLGGKCRVKRVDRLLEKLAEVDADMLRRFLAKAAHMSKKAFFANANDQEQLEDDVCADEAVELDMSTAQVETRDTAFTCTSLRAKSLALGVEIGGMSALFDDITDYSTLQGIKDGLQAMMDRIRSAAEQQRALHGVGDEAKVAFRSAQVILSPVRNRIRRQADFKANRKVGRKRKAPLSRGDAIQQQQLRDELMLAANAQDRREGGCEEDMKEEGEL